jgi:hypothetical protein
MECYKCSVCAKPCFFFTEEDIVYPETCMFPEITYPADASWVKISEMDLIKGLVSE